MLRLAALLLALFASAPAFAQFGPAVYVPAASSGSSYVGPGDVVSGWAFWGGLRAFSGATVSTKAANICNAGDAACADVNTLANGNFDVATATGAPLNCGGTGGTCTVKTLYDKSGNARDMIQATISKRPTLTFSCLGALPCMTFARVNAQILVSAAGVTQNQPMTIVAAANETSPNANDLVIGDTLGGNGVGFDFAGNLSYCQSGGTSGTQAETDGTWVSQQCLANGTSSSITTNGTTATFSGGTTGTGAGTIAMGQQNATATGDFNGKAVEGGIATTAFSAGTLSSMNSNIRTYWGF